MFNEKTQKSAAQRSVKVAPRLLQSMFMVVFNYFMRNEMIEQEDEENIQQSFYSTNDSWF
jgi:hypothetical protein